MFSKYTREVKKHQQTSVLEAVTFKIIHMAAFAPHKHLKINKSINRFRKHSPHLSDGASVKLLIKNQGIPECTATLRLTGGKES